MTTINKLAANRGAGWITDGLAVFKANPGTYLTACLLIGLISSLPLLGLFIGLVMPVFYGGLISLLHRQSRGEPIMISNAFDGFQQPGAFARLLPIVLLNLAFAVVVFMLLAVTIGMAVYHLISSGQTEPDPRAIMALLPKFALMLVILVPIGVFFGWVMMLAIPRAMLGTAPGMTAIRESFNAVLANIVPFLVNLLCLMLLMFIIVLIMMIPFMLLGVLQQHSRLLSLLIQIPLMGFFTGGIMAIYCSMMYQAWREIFGAEDVAATPPVDVFHA